MTSSLWNDQQPQAGNDIVQQSSSYPQNDKPHPQQRQQPQQQHQQQQRAPMAVQPASALWSETDRLSRGAHAGNFQPYGGLGSNAYIDSGSSGYPQAPAGVHYSQHPQDRQEALYHPVADQPRTARSDSTHGIAAYQQPEMSSPLSTGLTFANQHPPGFTYRGHSPASSVKSSPPARMAAFPHQSPVIDPMAHMHPHHRHNSVSSVSSSYEVASNWSPASPAAQHSRQNSLYSLPAQLDSVALGGTPQPESSLQVLPSGQQYVQTSPHVQHHLRYVSQADARRFSLDERSIRVQPQAKGQQAQGRHWPWGGATSGSGAPVHTRHGSMSGAPLHDYSHSNLFSSQSGGQPHVYSDAAQLQQPLSPTRFRSMSSSAISGRHVYGHPGQSAAASAAAAMGLGIGSQAGPSSVTLDGEAGSAPGPARRAKFKRSRTGCLVCRRRKVKCSQDGTPCRQCRIGKRDCHYEENPPKRKRRSRAQSNASEGALAKAAQHAQRLSSGDTSPSTSAHGMGALSRRYSEATTDRSSSPSGRESTLGSVTFSMPFTGPLSSNTAPSGAPGSTWTNTSPFASGSGPSSDTSLSTGLSPNNVDPALGGPTSWASEHERSYDSATSVASHHGHAANAGWFQPFDQAPPPPMGAHSFGPEVEVEDSQPRFIRSLQHGAQHGQ